MTFYTKKNILKLVNLMKMKFLFARSYMNVIIQ